MALAQSVLGSLSRNIVDGGLQDILAVVALQTQVALLGCLATLAVSPFLLPSGFYLKQASGLDALLLLPPQLELHLLAMGALLDFLPAVALQFHQLLSLCGRRLWPGFRLFHP